MKEKIARPGEIIVETGDSIISCYAIGSSIGICLYDSKKQIGGFVNSLLPQAPSGCENLKYVDYAIEILLEKMVDEGCNQDDLSAKMIGGADLFRLNRSLEEHNIGKANIKSAYQKLTALQIPIAGEDVGDTYGRTLYFHIVDGVVYIENRNGLVYHI